MSIEALTTGMTKKIADLFHLRHWHQPMASSMFFLLRRNAHEFKSEP
jgi:hypothetical protein